MCSLLVERNPQAWSLRLSWLLVLVAHVVLASLAFWFLPHGFPIFHPRFVLGTLAPLAEQARLTDMWLPQRGLFFIGRARFSVAAIGSRPSVTGAAS
jgi:multisubunit Na+/H+ antiporter MnhB subunit